MKIKLQGGVNFRDLGGIKNASGKQIKNKLFIRGGNLSSFTDEDVSYFVENYSIKSVIDLRTDTEMEELTDREIPGAEHINNALFSGAAAGISHETGASLEDIAKKNKGRKALYNAIPTMSDLYKVMFEDPEVVAHLSHAINIIIDNAISNHGTIYHCTKGKDRTGITTLIILTMLNVPKKTIIRDYLKTNVVVYPDGIKYWLAIAVFRLDIRSANKIFDCFTARRKFIDAIYASAEKNYGSIENFIRNGLNISDDRVAAFCSASLE